MTRRLFVAMFAASTVHAASTFVLSSDGLTVYDSGNNITWLANANLPAGSRFAIPACSGTNIGTQICINPSGSMNYNTAAAWVAAMNAVGYLGHNNWQLPTTPLSDKTCGKTGPNGQSFGYGCAAGALNSIYSGLGVKSPNNSVFPDPGSLVSPFFGLQPYLYWSHSASAGGASQGNATFSFATGWQGANTLDNFLYLWPTIPGKLPGTPPATGIYLQVNPGGQTVYDPITDITWSAYANLAASAAAAYYDFGLPVCASPTTPVLCVAQDGSMTWASAKQYLANMNAAAYLGQTNWQAPSASTCTGYACSGAENPMGNLFYGGDSFALVPGSDAVPTLDISVGPFNNLQPYLYWSCVAATIQDPCETAGPATNFEESYSFGSGFQGTDLLANSLFVTVYFVGTRTAPTGPEIIEVANAEGENPTIAPNTWVEIKVANIDCPTRIWQPSDFVNNQLPTSLNKISVTVNGTPAFVYYISPTQINILTPPNAITGPVQVQVSADGVVSNTFTIESQSLSPSFFVFGDAYVAATHLDGSYVGHPITSYPYLFTPARPGETVILYANGFGTTSIPVVSGSETQSGALSPLPVIQIGGVAATVLFAGLVAPGQYQFNVVIPKGRGPGDQTITAVYNGQTTQPGALITLQ